MGFCLDRLDGKNGKDPAGKAALGHFDIYPLRYCFYPRDIGLDKKWSITYNSRSRMANWI
jgi:hypothetical protein